MGELADAVRGALSVVTTGEGTVIDRLPEWTRARYGPIRGIEEASSQASGVRLEWSTGASWIELDLHITRHQFDKNRPPRGATIAVTTEDGYREDRRLEGGDVHLLVPPLLETTSHGSSTTVRFELGGQGEARLVTMWLPHTASVLLLAARADSHLAPAPRSRPRWIHYGSSISQCGEAESPLDVWPIVAARILDLDLTNLGLAGQAQLDPFVATAIAAEPAELISLKVGINVVGGATMRERTFVPAVHGFIDTIRDAHACTPIVVISPVLCPVHEDTPGPTLSNGVRVRATRHKRAPLDGLLTLRTIRSLLGEIVASRADSALHYLDGLDLLGAADAARLVDGLHPDTAGYRLIGNRFAAAAQRTHWMQQQPPSRE